MWLCGDLLSDMFVVLGQIFVKGKFQVNLISVCINLTKMLVRQENILTAVTSIISDLLYKIYNIYNIINIC